MVEDFSHSTFICIGESDEIGIEERYILYSFEVFSFYICKLSLFLELTDPLDIGSLFIRYHSPILSPFYF